jgi:hypothetical protein
MVQHILAAAENSEYGEFHHIYQASKGFRRYIPASLADMPSSARYITSEEMGSNSQGSLTALENQAGELHIHNLSLSGFHREFISKKPQEKFTEISGDKDLQTRNTCIACLALGWLISITSISVGVYILFSGQPSTFLSSSQDRDALLLRLLLDYT